MNYKFLQYLLLLILSSTFFKAHAENTSQISQPIPLQTLNNTNLWRTHSPILLHKNPILGIRFLSTAILSFMAAAISSAGGLGGGGLFIPILTIVGGLDVKTASTYSAFMVTGGSVASVGKYILSAKQLVDYDIALLCEPSMLLGVSCGVILDRVFPEWLVMVLFVVFISFSTFKTCKSGVSIWKRESQRVAKQESEEQQFQGETPWMKVAVLVLIWISFFVLYLLRGKDIIEIEACGMGYWMISSIQIPIAIAFTSWILFHGGGTRHNVSTQQEIGEQIRSQPADKLIFPIMALLAGILGGVFGIGGGMIISPILLQIGIRPEVTAATCSFMVLFSSSMSAIQYLMLGMEQIYSALIFATLCFIASLVGLTMIQKALLKHGRPSLIVFTVGTVMALSIVFMTSFGTMNIWRDYISGQSMGFKKPC